MNSLFMLGDLRKGLNRIIELEPRHSYARKTLGDSTFVSEVEILNFTIDPLAGEEMRRMIAEVYGAPPDILAATRAALAGERR